MDLQDIDRRIERIKEYAKFDFNAALCCESELREDFIAWLARQNIPNVSKMAAAVLSTNDIDFTTWND